MLYLVIATCVFAVLDSYFTHQVITQGKGREANPVLNKLFGLIGLVPALVLTRIVVFAAVYLYPETAYVLCPLFAFVAWKNWNNVRR